MNRTILSAVRALSVSAALIFTTAEAATVTYTAGDLFLGVRATAGAGATQDYLVNIGPASLYRDATAAFTVPGLGNLGADLVAVFGSDWKTRAEVHWGVAGTPGSSADGADPGRTLYAAIPRLTPSEPASAPARANSAAQAAPTNKLTSLVVSYLQTAGVANASTANNPVAIIQETTVVNSYASFHDETSSYSYFAPPIEGTFANGTAGSVLDLYRLTPASGAEVGTPGQFLGTLSLDDNAVVTFTPAAAISGATVSFAATSYAVDEATGSGKVTATITRGGGLADAFTVNFATADGSALAGSDYTATSTQLSFAANELQKTVDVPISNRGGFQDDRTFFVTLSGASGAASVISPATGPVKILEADASVRFSAAAYSVNEADASGKATLTLLRGNGRAGAFTVNFSTTAGTAAEGTDFTGQTNAQASFAANETQKTVEVLVANRAGFQGNRTFNVALSGVSTGATIISPSSATVTIVEAEVPPVGTLAFSAGTYQQAESVESDATLTITVSRSGGSDGAASVEVARTGGTATVGDDFTLPASPIVLSWAAGESGAKTFDVTIKADAIAEGTPETIVLALQNATGNPTIDTPSTATVSILDGDSTVPTLTVSAPRANARFTGANVTFTGNAKDNAGVGRVEVALNGGAPQTATPAGATTDFNWSLTLVPEQGANTAVITAFDLAGNASAAVTVSFKFSNLRPQLAGSYNGLIVEAAAGAIFDRNGLIAVKVGATGTFTGKVTISGVKLPISGVFLTGGAARFGRTLTPTFDLLKAGVSLGQLELTLDTGAGLKITGAIKNGANTVATITRADLAVYTSKRSPVAPFKNVPTTLLDPTREKGKYTGIFGPSAVVANTPQGISHGKITVSAKGTVKFVGKAADGSPISYTNALSSDNHWPFFAQPYGKKGFIAGDVTFDPTQTESDATGTLTWFKPAGLPNQKLYPNGWPAGFANDFAASKFIKPVSPATVLGVPGASDATTANIEIALTDGGAPDTRNDASIAATNKITVLGATAGSTAATGLKASFSAGTGGLSGSFTHPGNSKSVKFFGTVFQKTNSAAGYFLYLPTTGAAESGAISIVKK